MPFLGGLLSVTKTSGLRSGPSTSDLATRTSSEPPLETVTDAAELTVHSHRAPPSIPLPFAERGATHVLVPIQGTEVTAVITARTRVRAT